MSKERYLHVIGQGHGKVKGPEKMERNPILSPKKSSHEKALAKKGKKSGLSKLFSGKGLKFTEELERHKGERSKFR